MRLALQLPSGEMYRMYLVQLCLLFLLLSPFQNDCNPSLTLFLKTSSEKSFPVRSIYVMY